MWGRAAWNTCWFKKLCSATNYVMEFNQKPNHSTWSRTNFTRSTALDFSSVLCCIKHVCKEITVYFHLCQIMFNTISEKGLLVGSGVWIWRKDMDMDCEFGRSLRFWCWKQANHKIMGENGSWGCNSKSVNTFELLTFIIRFASIQKWNSWWFCANSSEFINKIHCVGIVNRAFQVV